MSDRHHLADATRAMERRATDRQYVAESARTFIRNCGVILGDRLPEPEVYAVAEKMTALILDAWRQYRAE